MRKVLKIKLQNKTNMINSVVSRLWEKTPKYCDECDDFMPADALSTKDVVLLTDSSTRDPTPDTSPIKLWPHQEAMLHRIREVEINNLIFETIHTESMMRYKPSDRPPTQRVCIGIMNDPPGSGKTYAILSHILTDTKDGPTIIIVPQNIFSQWKLAIETIFKNTDDLQKCRFCSSYADVMKVYGNTAKIAKNKVILLQDTFADTYMKVLLDTNTPILRLVIDEVDIMSNFISTAISTKYVWLLSASYTNQKLLGPYELYSLDKIVCKSDPAFVKVSINLPEPTVETILCEAPYIPLLKDVLTEKELKALHAGDHALLCRLMNKSMPKTTVLNFKEFLEEYAKHLLQKAEGLDALEISLSKLDSDDDTFETEMIILTNKIKALKRLRDNATQLQTDLETLPDISALNYKDKVLEGTIAEQIIADPTSKWLLFNDNTTVLIRYQAYLESKGIKTKMLDGGSQAMIEKTLKEYKDGEIQVLLLNSMIEGAGMNLENTSHLLFMHKTEEVFINQVVGRAQRFGRTTPLSIILLFNDCE
jgi:hypothetical protein